jgi:hypothetical protein
VRVTPLVAGLSLCAALLAAPRPAQAQIINNGGFEAGLTSWTTLDQIGSDGTFFVQSGTTSPVNGFSVAAPPEGVNAAMTDAQAPGSHVLYQDFVVPTGGGSFEVAFSLFLNNLADAFYVPDHLDFATPDLNQQARVDIVTTSADPFSVASGDVLQNLFKTAPADPLVSGYTNHIVDVTALFQARQGQTLRLRFAAVDNVAPFNFGVDAVDIRSSRSAPVVPEPSSLLLGAAGLVPMLGLVRRRGRDRHS